MVTIITGTTNKPVSSENLKSFFKKNSALEGYLYIGYPVIGTVDGAYPIDGLWISPEHGLVIFNLIEGTGTEGYDIIESGLCNTQNFPSIKHYPGNITEIGISNSEHAVFLKNISYTEMYTELVKKRQYNIKMIDGALITLLYRFRKNELLAHRLSFFPAPNLEIFQNEPELYIEDEIYLDLLDKRIVTVPLRFDFDSGEAFAPVEHPKSHLTLGQYKYCRIPVTSAVSPYQFLSFIMRNFYQTAKNKAYSELRTYNGSFTESITPDERKIIHICIPS